MRLRALAPWILLPPLAVVLVASWFTTRAVGTERHEANRLAQLALRDDVVGLSYSWVTSEATGLIAFDAFTYVPSSLAFASTAAVDWEIDASARLQSLRFTDGEGPSTLAQLETVGGTEPVVEEVLSTMDPSVFDDIADGRTAFIDPRPYEEALAILFEEMSLAEARGKDATIELGTLTERPPFWHDNDFVSFALASALVSLTGGVLALWRVGHEARDNSLRLARAEAHGQQLRRIISSARRFSAASDFPSLARTLMSETRELLGGELATLVRRNGARLDPVVVNGDLRVGSVATGDGAVGRCVETGAVTRTIVPFDPFLPGVHGPVAVLAAPLVSDSHVIGAIVVASRTANMFDENDEASLQLLALLAAGAVTAAQRYDSTVALALRDPLTGLANRRRLDQDLATAVSAETQVAFLMVDIDHFKAFNDRHGHQRGDDLLRLVASAISAAVRQGDIVYRYGGEEFSVLLPGADVSTAGGIAERVRTSVLTATAGTLQPVTVSVGVAAQVAPVVPTSLVERADAALYRAKEDGRDRVSLA